MTSLRGSGLGVGACLLAALSPGLALAQTISGSASAADGDSLTIGSQRTRLFGIDAPELDQTCVTQDQTWKCGEQARTTLAGLIGDERIDCRVLGTDQYGRILARCSTQFLELNEAMVELGWAIAYTQYSSDYKDTETRARQRRSGIWNSVFAVPAEHRKAQSPKEEAPAHSRPRSAVPDTSAHVPGCRIKGNRNRKGEWIYHMPGMPYYDVTRAEEFFCTEQQAQAGGYRRAIVQP
jgi:endonuclease YncB( thermonuclease family)